MYNNPYIMNAGLRGASALGKGGLFSSIKAVNWGTLLGNTQKTLGIINQAIPIVYQVKPIMNNARTMFKVMGAVRDDATPTNNYENINSQSSTAQESTVISQSTNQPMFFI